MWWEDTCRNIYEKEMIADKQRRHHLPLQNNYARREDRTISIKSKMAEKRNVSRDKQMMCAINTTSRHTLTMIDHETTRSRRSETMGSWASENIITTSINEKLKILDSVLLTVLKFLFSRVRKYFCMREMVLSCDETLKMVSSSCVVWVWSAPALTGIWACFCSSST